MAGTRTQWQRLREDLDAAVAHDPAARSRWEVALLYSGVHAVWAHRLAHWLWRRGSRFTARAVSQAARMLTGIEIHPGAQIGARFFIDHGSGVVIGETARVGDDVMIYHGVTLGATRQSRGKRHPTIGDRVVIGAGAAVLGDVTVGSDSRIGANAVLVRSVEPCAVVVGVPGQVISTHRPVTAPPPTDDTERDPIATGLQSLLLRVARIETRLGERPERDHLTMSSIGQWEEDEDYAI